MVGDSGTDIKTARAAGVPVIAVDFGYADVPVKEFGPDRVISHFDQLLASLRRAVGRGGNIASSSALARLRHACGVGPASRSGIGAHTRRHCSAIAVTAAFTGPVVIVGMTEASTT